MSEPHTYELINLSDLYFSLGKTDIREELRAFQELNNQSPDKWTSISLPSYGYSVRLESRPRTYNEIKHGL